MQPDHFQPDHPPTTPPRTTPTPTPTSLSPLPRLPDFSRLLGPWSAHATCLTADAETFFPDKGGSIEPARRICLGDPEFDIPPCPVQVECLEYALNHEQNDGVWGGMSARERVMLLRRRRQDRRP